MAISSSTKAPSPTSPPTCRRMSPPSIHVVSHASPPCKDLRLRDITLGRYSGSSIVSVPAPESERRVVVEAGQRILDRAALASKKSRKIAVIVKNCELMIGAPVSLDDGKGKDQCAVQRIPLQHVLRIERMAVSPGSKRRSVLALLCRHQRPGRELALATHVLVFRSTRQAQAVTKRIGQSNQSCRFTRSHSTSSSAAGLESESDSISISSSSSSSSDDELDESGVVSDFDVSILSSDPGISQEQPHPPSGSGTGQPQLPYPALASQTNSGFRRRIQTTLV